MMLGSWLLDAHEFAEKLGGFFLLMPMPCLSTAMVTPGRG